MRKSTARCLGKSLTFFEELPFISTVGWPVQPYIVKNGLRNFRGGYFDDNTLRHEGFIPPWTYYWDEPDKRK